MVVYSTSKTGDQLNGILELQRINLSINLSKAEIHEQGFVTVKHSFEELARLNEVEQHIIATEGNKIIAYLLAMTAVSRPDIPVLIPMFDLFDRITFRNKPVSGYKYIVVGQVCVDINYRGQGILDNCYAAYKDHFNKNYEFAITEIAASNLRSVNAHKRINFKEIYRYFDPGGTEWSIVVWDWRDG